jgi:hypothetical protein
MNNKHKSWSYKMLNKMYQIVRLSNDLSKKLVTVALPTYAQACVNAKLLELKESATKTVAAIDKIITSVNLDQTLNAIEKLDNDFVNSVIWEIRKNFDLSKLDKLEFLEKFHEYALNLAFVKREEIEKIYFNYIDILTSRHTE